LAGALGIAAGGLVAADGAEAEQTTSAATPLKVMDWNVQGGQGADGVTDFDRVVEVIRAEDPDIVTLQELHNNEAVGGENQWQRLLDEFPAYDAHFARSDENALGGDAGNLILSKFPIEERLTHRLPQYPADSDAVLRSLGGARVMVGGADLRIYTTHLSSGVGAEATERRNRQARDVIDTLPPELMTTPMLLTGDLNVRPDDVIRPWFAEAGWIDAWTQVNANIGGDAVTHPGSGDDARIDYVYGTAAFEVAGARTVATEASDHLPVVADLVIRDGGAVAATGTVLAGADGRAGWAHAAELGDGSGVVSVCDNKADGWGVRAYLGGASAATGADPAYADPCGVFTVPAGSPSVRVCLYQAGVEKDCRETDRGIGSLLP
jgi:endonuclease/exonuclease/phosphatase family metal-dependent hydrolase